MFGRDLGGRAIARNTNITLQDGAQKSFAAVNGYLRAWAQAGRPNEGEPRALASAAANTELSKFEPCLPDAALSELQTSRLFDPRGARLAI